MAVGIVMVVTSPVVRGALTAIAWFVREPVAVTYVDSLSAAYKWAFEHCDAAGIAIPDHVRQQVSTGQRGSRQA